MAGRLSNTTKFSDVFLIMSHNSYELGLNPEAILSPLNSNAPRYTSGLDTDTLNYINSSNDSFAVHTLELDVFPESNYGVGHDLPGPHTLGTYISALNYWHSLNPNHFPVTVFIDLKNPLGGHSDSHSNSQMLHKHITEIGNLPYKDIFKPKDLLQSYETLRQAANAGWPTINELRGKFIFLLSGGLIGRKNESHNAYVEQQKEHALVFVCPDCNEISDVTARPEFFKNGNEDWVIAHNINIKKVKEGKKKNHELGKEIRKNNYLSHVWGHIDDDETYSYLINKQKINFLGIDEYDNPIIKHYNCYLPQGDYASRDLNLKTSPLVRKLNT